MSSRLTAEETTMRYSGIKINRTAAGCRECKFFVDEKCFLNRKETPCYEDFTPRRFEMEPEE